MAYWFISKQEKIMNNTQTDPLEVQVGGDHYKRLKIQPVEFIKVNNLGFLEGCVIKRLCRYKHKDPAKALEDLGKARHEIDLLIKFHTEDINEQP